MLLFTSQGNKECRYIRRFSKVLESLKSCDKTKMLFFIDPRGMVRCQRSISSAKAARKDCNWRDPFIGKIQIGRRAWFGLQRSAFSILKLK